MNPGRREEKDSIYLASEEFVDDEAITRLDLHGDPDEGTLSGCHTVKDVKDKDKAAEQTVCTRCGAELQVLTNLAWCLRCGFTKRLQSDSDADTVTAAESQEDMDVRRYLGLLHEQSQRKKLELELSTLRRREGYIPLLPIRGMEVIPEWLAVLVCGLLICVIGAFTVAANLRASPEPRLIWCVAQAAVGLVLVLLAHPIAFLLVVPHKLRTRQLKMFFTPFLWLMVWRGLPHTRWAIYLWVWGLGLVAGAAFIHIAGLRVWF